MSSLNRPQAPQGVFAPFAALVAGAVAMGVSPIFVRLADVGPFTSAFWRVTLALPLLYAWTRLADRREDSGKRFSKATILAGLAFAADLFFWHLSIVHTSVANATFFATTAPIWVVLFGWLLFRQKATAGVLAGLGLCLIGGAAPRSASRPASFSASISSRSRRRGRRPPPRALPSRRRSSPLRSSSSLR
jgi:drug/metabolite transporter (DMT)-like permease